MPRLIVLIALALALPAHAQPRFAPVPEGRHSAPPASPAPSSGARFGATPYADPQAERCANLRKEYRAARHREREAGTTTSSDQASLHRQDLLEQLQKAGC